MIVYNIKGLAGSSRNPNSPGARHTARLILRRRPRPRLRAVSARHTVPQAQPRRPRARAQRRHPRHAAKFVLRPNAVVPDTPSGSCSKTNQRRLDDSAKLTGLHHVYVTDYSLLVCS
jgi:hypothetical protein